MIAIASDNEKPTKSCYLLIAAATVKLSQRFRLITGQGAGSLLEQQQLETTSADSPLGSLPQ